MGGHVVRAAVERAGIDPAMVDDVLMGAAAQQGTQAYNLGRLCGVAGGTARHGGRHDHGSPVFLGFDDHRDCGQVHYV